MAERERRKARMTVYKRVVLEDWGRDKSRGVSLSAFCREHGLSRGTLYAWLKNNGSREKAILHHADPKLKAKALEIYLRYKGTWCAETISMALKGLLSVVTIRKIIAPHRRISALPIRRRKSGSSVLPTAALSNAVWSVDWTEFKIRGKKFFILLFMDEASRFYLGWYIFTASPTGNDVTNCLRDILARYEARPFIIKSDRAKVFFSAQWLGLLARNGITSHKIRPHCPQDQGVIERGMREIKTWLRANDIANGEALAECLDEGMFMLNFLKPKIVLNAVPPAKAYFYGDNSAQRSEYGEVKFNTEGLCIAR